MNIRIVLFSLIAAVTLTTAACGGGGDDFESVSDELCHRFDECNALDGVSANECTSVISSCVSELSAGEERDWELDIQDCLDYSSCNTFIECYWTVPFC